MQTLTRLLSVGLAALAVAAVSLVVLMLMPGGAAAAEIWQGSIAGDEANVRAAPSSGASLVGTLPGGQPVGVEEWVLGEKVVGKNDVWARIGDGRFVYSGLLTKDRPAAPPAPPSAPTSGRWIDINLTQQVATAYEGTRPVNWAVVSTGTVGWETPQGTFPILRRVENETMDSSSLAVLVTGEGVYRLTDVLYTQYLTKWGHAIHSNYWKWDSPFGVPTSHGCIGMKESDARFFWDFATEGTSVVIHS